MHRLPILVLGLLSGLAGAQSLVQVTRTGVGHGYPAITADGRTLFWKTDHSSPIPANRRSDIMMADARSLKTRVVASSAPPYQIGDLGVSGDGTAIAFNRLGVIWMVPTAGGVPVRTGIGSWGGNVLDLSHDGSKLLVDQNIVGTIRLRLYDVALARATTVAVVPPARRGGSAAFSGDGSTIVYALANPAQIVFARTDATPITTISLPGLVSVGDLELSHRGRRCAFTAFPTTSSFAEVYSLDRRAVSPINISNDGRKDKGIVLSGDGERVTWISDRGTPWAGDIYMAHPDGRDLRRITTGGSFMPDLIHRYQHTLNGDGTVALLASPGNLTGRNPNRDRHIFLWKDALTRSGAATPGGRVSLHLDDAASKNANYFVRCAFSRSNVLRIPGVGTVPLTPDVLFFLSGSVPTIFRNFNGTLDAFGRGTATIAIPNAAALRGIPFLTASIAVGGAGAKIHNSLWITIQ